MRTIIKNLINTLKRFRLATTFNILGLSTAFAAFIIIMMQVNYERSFDKCHPTFDRVFRAELPHPQEGIFSIILPRALVETIMQSSPHIEAATIINPYLGQIYFTINENGERKGFRDVFVTCSPGITHVFGFTMVEGDKDCLSNPDYVIIPESLAKILYGNVSAIGKSLHCEEQVWSKDRPDLIVGGVYKDLPENTQLKNAIYTAMDHNFSINNWRSSNYLCYLLLDNKEAATDVIDNFNRNFDFSKLGDNNTNKIDLTSLTDIYFLNDSQDGNITKSGNKQTTNLIILIAVLVVAVAAINFMNFSTSLAPLRIKNINIQKVLGCSNGVLKFSLMIEAVSITLFSYLLSILYVVILNEISVLSFIDANLSISDNLLLIGACSFLALLVGVLAGTYPAIYMTSFAPALALKGNFSVSPTGRLLRTLLIGIQFVISIGLIIATSFIWLQNRYMEGYSLGFDKDQIAIVELNENIYRNHREKFVNQLKSYSGIEDIAFSMQKLGSGDSYSASGIEYKGQSFDYFMLPVSWNFTSVMGIPIVGGRGANISDESPDHTSFLVNKDAQEKYSIELGIPLESNDQSSVIGFVDNVKFTSLRKENDNIVLVVDTRFPLQISYIRLKAGTDYFAAVDHIRKTISQIDPSYPFDIQFYDTLFEKLYHKEENLRKMITVLSLLAIIISIVGVFGLVIFETSSRRKEIGIRKVHGATIGEILLMLNQLYIRIILICFIIAVPLVYFGVFKWLEGFAYRTPMYWWVFIVGGLLILLLTVAIVSIQSWKAARANPVDSIKDE